MVENAKSKEFLIKPIHQESDHPYQANCNTSGIVRLAGADFLCVEFDRHCGTDNRHDLLTILDQNDNIISARSGRDGNDWLSELRVVGGTMFELHFVVEKNVITVLCISLTIPI